MNEDLLREILAFRDERNWRQYHNPKDLAISLTLEAAELLETFQWSGADTEAVENQAHMAEELADVLIYAVLFADALDFDITTIVRQKMAQNRKKYPPEKAYGSKKKYTELG